jgi:hypothetical protein
MRMPSALLVVGALILALPFGWGLGVVAACLIAGPDFGQLPVGTIPVCIVGAVVFVITSPLAAQWRLAIMAVGTAAFLLLGYLMS